MQAGTSDTMTDEKYFLLDEDEVEEAAEEVVEKADEEPEEEVVE